MKRRERIQDRLVELTDVGQQGWQMPDRLHQGAKCGFRVFFVIFEIVSPAMALSPPLLWGTVVGLLFGQQHVSSRGCFSPGAMALGRHLSLVND
jgi:hypothetical protein